MSDIFSQGLNALSSLAPTLATMIGGPLAGTAVSALEGVFGLAPTGDKAAALQAVVSATPEQLLALKAEDNRHAETLEKLVGNDRDNARKREEAVMDRIPGLLAIALTVGFFGLLGYLVGHEPPQGSRDIINIMLGSLGTGWATMMAYYFGASNDATKQVQTAATKN